MSFAVSNRGVFFHDGTCIRSLDPRSGQALFKTEPVVLDRVIATATTPTLAVYKDVVLLWGGADQPEFRGKSGSRAANSLRTLTAVSAVDGRKLWSCQTPEFSTGFECPKDILVIDDLVWLGIMMGGGENAGTWTGRNVHTGEVEREFKPPEGIYWFHQRCHRSKATERYIVSGRTGIEFVSPKTGWESINHWVRGACIYGTMPANGLIYQPPHPCACYVESLLRGFNALAPAGPQGAEHQDTPRLERGPAYGQPVLSPVSASAPPDEWPTFRHDNARSCFAGSSIAANLKVRWQVRAGTQLSALTAAGGKLFVADKDAHVLRALDTESGKEAWVYRAGARIDSPPALALGRVLFGSKDGYLYCLNAADGALVWRYRVAPVDRYLLAGEQLESVWPVHGSPLVIDDRVYCVAGRSAFLDGGMRFLCLDIKTGKTLNETVLDENDPTTGGKVTDKMSNRTMPVTNPDILSYNGRSVFMNTQRFNLDGSRPVVEAMRKASDQLGEDAHLFVNSGFLDDSGFHRTLMLYGRTYSGGDAENHEAAKYAPGGMMLAFNDTHVFGFSRLPHLYRWVRELEWHIYKTSKTERKPMPPKEGQGLSPAFAANDVVIRTDSTEEKELTRLKTSLLSTTIKYDWSNHDPDLYGSAMVLTRESLFVAGPPAIRNESTAEALARWQGERGGMLWCLSTESGEKKGQLRLPSPPVYEGMAAAYNRIFMALKDGSVICLEPAKE
jgi:outer membrane protein assembly factor BamB